MTAAKDAVIAARDAVITGCHVSIAAKDALIAAKHELLAQRAQDLPAARSVAYAGAERQRNPAGSFFRQVHRPSLNRSSQYSSAVPPLKQESVLQCIFTLVGNRDYYFLASILDDFAAST